MTLDPDDPKLTAYVLGELEESERKAVEAQLPDSLPCRQAVDEIRQAARLLEQELADEACPGLTAQQKARVLAASPPKSGMLARLLGWQPAFSTRRRSELALTGFAAAVMLVLALVWLPRWRSPQPSAVAPSQAASAGTTSSLRALPAPSITAPSPTLPIAPASSPPVADLAPLPLKLPMPAFIGTPTDIQIDEHMEKPSEDPRPPFLAPKGVQNVALKKKVTSSDKSPITGTLELVTDGDKEARDDSFLELHRKTQWIQIDLEKEHEIHVVMIWHAHNTPQLYHDVVVQVANDPDFLNEVATAYNNDWDNSSGLGVGKDKEYFENYEGRLIPAKGVKGRYVRLYSKGSTYSALNRYTEVEVWALPVTTSARTMPIESKPTQSLQTAMDCLSELELTPTGRWAPQPWGIKVALSPTSTELAPLPLKLPMPAFITGPTDIPKDEHMEKLPDNPRPPFLAPKGVQNVALKKKVTSSDQSPISGTLELVTDGDKEARDDSFLELHRKTQWIQLDLEKEFEIHVIVVWHAHNVPQWYRDVIVQVSNGPDFLNRVTTVFNNDWDNSSGLGVGKDKEYCETYEGRLIPAKGVKGRYVRLYSKGSTYSALNRYIEVEVWAIPMRPLGVASAGSANLAVLAGCP